MTFTIVNFCLRSVSAAPVFTPPRRCSMLCHVPESHATYTVQSAGNWAAFKSAITGGHCGNPFSFLFNPATGTAWPLLKRKNENKIKTGKGLFTGFSFVRKSAGLASYWLPLSLQNVCHVL